MQCSRCGEDDVTTIDHDDPTTHIGCPSPHAYCGNCDNDLCCGDC